MFKWEKRVGKAWLHRFEKTPHGTRAPGIGGPVPAPAPNAPTLTQSEHLQGLWITLGLADEEAAVRREEAPV
jgi:hypothetical protein